MFNKIIDKTKIIEELNEYSATTLVNSRNEEIGAIVYDYAYYCKNGKGYVKFGFNDSSLEYVLKLQINNILMYDKKGNKLYIKTM